MEPNTIESDKQYELGLALSGGGLKGFAHAGALQAMKERGLKPDIISGTSAGAIVAVLYSAGLSPIEICEFFEDKSFTNFTALTLPVSGIFNPTKFREMFAERVLPYKNLEDLPIPVRILATDLDHGRSVVFSTGSIAERVMASCSVPVIFVPQVIDGVNYVDGGVFLNFPVRTIRRDCKKVIGVNVSPLVAPKYSLNIMGIANRSYEFLFRANTLEDRRKCDVLIEVAAALKYDNSFDLTKVEEIFQLGYEKANRKLNKGICELK